MSRYLLIESRDPFESNGVAHIGRLARELASAGNEVTLLLVQDAVATARRGASAALPTELAAHGVKVLADTFSLRERAIPADKLVAGIEPINLDVVIDHMARGAKTIWH